RWTQALRSTSRSRSTCRRWSPPCAEPSAKTHPPARYRSPDDAALAALGAPLGFLQLRPRAPELQLLHRWLDTWAGIGLISVGLHRQGWDLLLTQYGDGHWRDLLRHRPVALHRRWLGVEAAPWTAVQLCARFVLKAPRSSLRRPSHHVGPRAAGIQVARQERELGKLVVWPSCLTRHSGRRNGEVAVSMNALERAVTIDLIESVRSLARQVLTLHLQLGAYERSSRVRAR